MSQNFRWGIIGCGLIAPKFFQELEKTGEGHVVAAASKSMRRARKLGKELGIKRVYDSYEEMLEREQLDAVYIATSHNFHAENAILCLNHNLPVLVEKPFTMNAIQAEEVIALARQKKLFCMEAMWTRFNPATVKLQEMLADGVIGDIKHLRADFCVQMKKFSAKMMPWNRMYSRRLAGGALLDLGVYSIAYASMVFRQSPDRISSTAKMTYTGVDKSSEVAFQYPGNARADMKISFVGPLHREAVITGTNGIIKVPTFSWTDHFTVLENGKPPQTVSCGEVGFAHEIRETHRCIREGLTESPGMPLDETLEIARTMDAIRSQWGMKYPGE